MKKYLISGIAPSPSGVGHLMSNMVKLANNFDFNVLHPYYYNTPFKKVFLNPSKLIKWAASRMISRVFFLYQISGVKKSEIILIHPQTIGLYYFIKLIRSNFRVKIYIMDNSFFCVKSYNVLNGTECVKCLNSLDSIDASCQPFPVKMNKEKNIDYLKLYKKYSNKIEFFAQNIRQKNMLKLHFGEETNVSIIGMRTGEKFTPLSPQKNKGYDIVFHGEAHEAKGIEYVLNLAEHLGMYSILIPCDRRDIKSKVHISKNITFKKMNWNNGLKIEVENAKLVMNPSLWSSAIEGALLKSIYYNGNVAVVGVKYGFVSDIPGDILIRLNSDTLESSKIIENFFAKRVDKSEISKKWLESYYREQCDESRLFQ
jgi:hypothetical protein